MDGKQGLLQWFVYFVSECDAWADKYIAWKKEQW